MDFYKMGMQKGKPTPEEEEMELYSDLLCMEDNDKETMDDWEATILAFGCRSKPLPRVSDYKIPQVGCHSSRFSGHTEEKRVGKGRSRLSNKPKVDRVRLDINQEFEMYDNAPVNDFMLPIVKPNGYIKADSSIDDKDDDRKTNGDLSVRPKVKAPSFSGQDPMPLPKFSPGEHSSIANGYVPSHIVPIQNKYRHEQFLDYEDESPYRPVTVDEDSRSRPTLNLSEAESRYTNELKNIGSPSKIRADVSPDKPVNKTGSRGSGSVLSESEDSCSTLTYKSAISELNTKSSTCLIGSNSMKNNTETSIPDEAKKDIESSCAYSNQSSTPQLIDDSPTDSLPIENLKVHDWWDNSGTDWPENINPSLSAVDHSSSIGAQSKHGSNNEKTFRPITEDRRSPFSESSDVSSFEDSSSASSTCECFSPVVQALDKRIQADLDSGTLFKTMPVCLPQSKPATLNTSVKPNKTKQRKLKTFNHAEGLHSNEHLPVQQPSVRQRPYGWGDSSYKATPAPHRTLYEPKRALGTNANYSFGIHPTVSAHGNAEDMRNCLLNACLKPTPRSAPVFFEDDFPSLSGSHEEKRRDTPSPVIKKDDEPSICDGLADDRVASGFPENVIPEPAVLSYDFDRNTVVIENVPPNAESILREILTPFNTKMVSFFYTGQQYVAYVRLEDEDNCKWLIDCLDDMIPGGELNIPLKLKKLN